MDKGAANQYEKSAISVPYLLRDKGNSTNISCVILVFPHGDIFIFGTRAFILKRHDIAEVNINHVTTRKNCLSLINV